MSISITNKDSLSEDILRKIRKSGHYMSIADQEYVNINTLAPLLTNVLEGLSEQAQYNDYRDSDIIQNDSLYVQVVYGEVWLDDTAVQAGKKRDPSNPLQIIDSVTILLGDGENEGIVGDPWDSSEGLFGPLKNVAVNDKPWYDEAADYLNIADSFIRIFDGVTGEGGIWDDIGDVFGVGKNDPRDNKSLEKEKGTQVTHGIKDHPDVSGSPGENRYLVGNSSGGFDIANIRVQGLDVYKDGGHVGSDIDSLDFVGADVVKQGTVATIQGLGGGAASNICNDGVAVYAGGTNPMLFRGLKGGDNIFLSVEDGCIIISTQPVDPTDPTDPTDPPPPQVDKCTQQITPKVEITSSCVSDSSIQPPSTQQPGLSLLEYNQEVTVPINAIGTNGIEFYFHIDGLVEQKKLTYSLNTSNSVPPQFSCFERYPLEAENEYKTPQLPPDGVCIEPGSIKINITIYSDICGQPTVIASGSISRNGYYETPFMSCIVLYWTGNCFNRFPGEFINENTNTRAVIKRVTQGQTAAYYAGYTMIPGNDWFDGGNNLSREDNMAPIEEVYIPIIPHENPTPTIPDSDCIGQGPQVTP